MEDCFFLAAATSIVSTTLPITSAEPALFTMSMRSRLALKVEGLARVSKSAGGRPRLASVAFDGRYMGLVLW